MDIQLINAKYKQIKALTTIEFYERLKVIALSMFIWEGLPESCNARFLEKCLYEEGKAIFVKHKRNGGIINLRCTPAATMTIYDEYDGYVAHSVGYSESYHADGCVYVRNNYLEKTTEETLWLYALRLADIQRAMDVNIKAQKTPILVLCDEKERLTYKNIYKDYEGDAPVIYGSKLLNIDNFKVLKTDAPYVADRLYEQKMNLWNEALAYLGINTNPSTDKKERLITNEVDANNEQTDICANSFLLTRQEACVQLKKVFDIDVTVKVRKLTNNEKEDDQEDVLSSTDENEVNEDE